MTAPPAAPEPGHPAGEGVLRELKNAAAVKRAARQRIADAAAHPGVEAADLAEHRAAHDVATVRWVSLLRAAAHDGHPIAVIARAAGVTAAAAHYRLTTPSPAADGEDLTGEQARRRPDEPQETPKDRGG